MSRTEAMLARKAANRRRLEREPEVSGGLVGEVMEFLSPEAGQARTEWLNETINDNLDYFLGPTGLPERVNAVMSMTPAAGVQESIQGTRTALNPDLSFGERMGGVGQAALGIGTTVAPAVALKFMPSVPGASASDDFARSATALEESLLGASKDFAVDEFGGVAPRITPRDLEGARVIPTVADLTKAGGEYTGIDASKIDVPEPLMGGPGYPLLDESLENRLAWAVQGKHIGTKKAGKDADLIAVTAMNPDSHRSNITFKNSLLKTIGAYARDDRIAPEVLAELDEAVRVPIATGNGGVIDMSTFPGFESPELSDWISRSSFEQRKRVADVARSKRFQNKGLPNVNRILEETVDPRYAGANPRDTLLFIKPDKNAPPVDLAAEGLPVHPSYQYGIRGEVFGQLDEPLSVFEMFPDFWDERGITSATEEAYNKGGRRSFDLALPVQEVTGDQVRNMERALTMQAAGGAGLSPADTRILTNSLLGNWKTTQSAVNAGGVSPQKFVDALNNNKYAPALSPYTAKEVSKGAKSGDLVVKQLGDDDLFFGIDAKPDYSWAGVEMQPGDKALVGVVSNVPGSRGTAAPSVLAQAIEDGVTVLDAFAVPSQRFPEGFLPDYYSEFGFETVGEVPFDKDMYIGEHGAQAFEDLKDAWRSDGWDESLGMPPVRVMRWSGSDADRASTAAAIRGTNPAGAGGPAPGLVSEAEGPAGQVAGSSVRKGAPGDGRGAGGQVGAGDGFRLSGRARESAGSLPFFTDQQLLNKGVPQPQIDLLKGR